MVMSVLESPGRDGDHEGTAGWLRVFLLFSSSSVLFFVYMGWRTCGSKCRKILAGDNPGTSGK
jgi:hypothetical protein